MGSAFRSFLVVIFKNILLRKQQYLLTILEIAVPILFTLMIVGWADTGGGSGFKVRRDVPTYFKAVPEQDFKWNTASGMREWCKSDHTNIDPTSTHFLAYTPDTPEMAQLMNQVSERVCQNSPSTPADMKKYVGWFPVANESELDSMYEGSWKYKKGFHGAVVFVSEEKNQNGGMNITYKIRMKPDLLPYTSKVLPVPERDEFIGDPDFLKVGPNLDHASEYLNSGFLGLQLSVDQCLAQKVTGKEFTRTVLYELFPYPPYKQWVKRSAALKYIFYVYSFSLLFTIPSICRNLVGEKSSGITELLRIVGVSSWVHWLTYLIHSLLPHIIVVPIIILLLYVPFDVDPVVLYSDPMFLGLILFLYVCASVAFIFALCALFDEVILSIFCCELVWLVTNFIGIYFLLNDSSTVRTIISFSVVPSVALAVILKNVHGLETQVLDESGVARGAHWSSLLETVETDERFRARNELNNLETVYILVILLVDFCLYMVLAIFLDICIPSEHSVKDVWCASTKENQQKAQVVPALITPKPDQMAQEIQLWPQQLKQWQYSTSLVPIIGNSSISSQRQQLDRMSTISTQSTPISEPQSRALSAVVAANPGFEPEPDDAAIGVEIDDLCKRFHLSKAAVNSVSLKACAGQIFVLLGHSGAGKSTLLSMLTGRLAPTSGTAKVDGYDIKQDKSKVRDRIGYSPQKNICSEELTPQQQLWLVGMLRGLSYSAAKAEAIDLVEKMNLKVKPGVAACELDDNQQRKLSLATSMIGGTSVVVLDSPSSGLDRYDIQTRMEIWNVIRQLRGQRTVVVATHFVDEAEALGDRISIIANGILQCCGSATFLNNYYEIGSTLKFTLRSLEDEEEQVKEEDEDNDSVKKAVLELVPDPFRETQPNPETILSTVQRHVPNASLKTNVVNSNPNEIFISLPSATATSKVLAEMFAVLVPLQAKWGVSAIELHQTSLDDIFYRVGEAPEEEVVGVPLRSSIKEGDVFLQPPKASSLLVSQLKAQFAKKATYWTRRWKLLILQILIPFLFVGFFLSKTKTLLDPQLSKINGPNAKSRAMIEWTESESDPLEMSLKAFEEPVTLYSEEQTSFPYLADVIGSSARVSNNPLKDLLDASRNDLVFYKRHYIVAVVATSSEFKAMFNHHPYHAAPLAINLASNSLLQDLDPVKKNRIVVINHPFYKETTHHKHVYDGMDDPKYVKAYMSFIIPLALLLIVSLFMVQPLHERLCRLKQLELMTGLSPTLYWIVTFLWDYLIYFMDIIILPMSFAMFDFATGYDVFTKDWSCFLVFICILMVYGFSGILFSYLFSTRLGSRSVGGGFSLLIFTHLVTGILLGSTTLVWEYVPQHKLLGWVNRFFNIVGGVFPTFYLTRAMYQLANIAVCQAVKNTSELNCPPDTTDYLLWSQKIKIGNEEYIDSPDVGQSLLLMGILGIVYLILLLFYEYGILSSVANKALACWKTAINPNDFPPSVEEKAVLVEENRVNQLVRDGRYEAECVLVQNLSISRKGSVIVSRLHFGVHHGQCFGLVGFKGAGKTAVCQVLAGEQPPVTGNVFAFATSLLSEPGKFLRNVGYCPQSNALLEQLTGKEMLQLFARLRNVHSSKDEQEAGTWLRRMGLQDNAEIQCRHYSLGMQRRLAIAMAMIGGPELIVLDAPTRGVDPVSQREFWKIFDRLKEAGQSIILSSRSIMECEALCSRVGIIVNGQLHYVGSIPYLKNKYAKGYRITLKLTMDSNPESEQVKEQLKKVEESLRERFEFCEVMEHYHNKLVKYLIQNPAISWDVLFKRMEMVKAEFSGLIEDYWISETTLEEAFRSLASSQKAVVEEAETCKC